MKYALLLLFLLTAGCTSNLPKTENREASCESAITANCFVVRGTAKSSSDQNMGLVIETETGEYAVFEVASHARADREKCDSRANCFGRYSVCPIDRAPVERRQPVCLNEIKIEKLVPADQ